MDRTECTTQLELFEVCRQQVTLDYEGEGIVSDAGLLPVAKLDRELGILAEAASRLPDPRMQEFVTHSAEQILRRQVYQILAGYSDGNDAQLLRHDPLLKTIVGKDPRCEDEPLASGSTINRFQHAFTRREAEKPIEVREKVSGTCPGPFIDTEQTRILNNTKRPMSRLCALGDRATIRLVADRQGPPWNGGRRLVFQAT